MTTTRDRWGIPHIESGDLDGLFRGQGHACAQDRLWQIEWDRRRALGRVSELVGAGGLHHDRFARRLRLADAARAGHAALDAETRAMLDAYASGVNDAIAGGARAIELERLGVAPEPWEPWHSVAAFLVRHVAFAAPWLTKLFRARVLLSLGADAALALRREGAPGDEVVTVLGDSVRIPPPGVDVGPVLEALREVRDLLDTAPAAGDDGGSNSWVLDGSRTASGRSLVAGDPHRALESPNVYLQVYLRAPGIDVAGLAFAGVPGVAHFGHTGPVAWCVTNAAADCDDLYVERQGSEVDRRTETIHVLDGDDVEVDSMFTRHGPVLFGDTRDGSAIALRAAGLQAPGAGFGSILPLLRARTVDDVDAAVDAWVDPVNNWLAADAGGHTLYRTGGHVPRRGELNRWLPVPGWTDDHEWDGLLDDLPRERDPHGGLIVTANNRIRANLSVDFSSPGRAVRVRERLRDVRDASLGSMAAVHRDVVTLPGLKFVDEVRSLAVEGDAKLARDVLIEWDGRMHRDSTGAAVYASVRAALARLVAQRMPRAVLPDEPPGATPPIVRVAMYGRYLPWRDELVPQALAEGWRALGADPASVRWGALHWSRHTHGLARLAPEIAQLATGPTVEVDGDGECVLATHSLVGASHEAVQAPVARYVFEVGDRPAGGWVVPLGASGDPSSPHFADQQPFWASGELLPIEP